MGIAPQTPQSDFRYRFGSDYYFRQTTGRSNRVQPQEAGTKKLSSVVLFLSASSRILAWNFASRQCRFFYWSYPVPVFVTNLKMSAWRVYLFYNPRATIEKNNREFLYDYPLAKIPSNSWKANVAFFQLLLFSANIVHWFKRLCLPKEYWTATLDTIRTDFLVLPAKMSKHGSQNILVLPKDYHYRKEFQEALRKIQKLRLTENFRFCK